MASSLRDQLLKKGLAKETDDGRVARARNHAEEVKERLEDETLVPAFEAAATGRIVDKPSTVTRTTDEEPRKAEEPPEEP